MILCGPNAAWWNAFENTLNAFNTDKMASTIHYTRLLPPTMVIAGVYLSAFFPKVTNFRLWRLHNISHLWNITFVAGIYSNLILWSIPFRTCRPIKHTSKFDSFKWFRRIKISRWKETDWMYLLWGFLSREYVELWFRSVWSEFVFTTRMMDLIPKL